MKNHPYPYKGTAGMTLMELLVATILVGIVMIGTVSVDFAIHSMRKSTTDASTVALQTSAAMLEITSNLAKSVGDAQNMGIVDCTQDNAAIGYPGCSNFVNPTFCARQDVNDPNVYTDDRWVCFWKPSIATDANIYKCTRTAAQGPGSCTNGDEIIGTAACNAGCASYALTFSLNNNNPIPNQFFFNITLKNRAYPLQQLDPAKPLKNPEYELSSHITPMGHSY